MNAGEWAPVEMLFRSLRNGIKRTQSDQNKAAIPTNRITDPDIAVVDILA
jgi:hypothetical protein